MLLWCTAVIWIVIVLSEMWASFLSGCTLVVTPAHGGFTVPVLESVPVTYN